MWKNQASPRKHLAATERNRMNRVMCNRLPQTFGLLLLAVALGGAAPTTQPASTPKPGDTAPDFALDSLDGTTVRLSDMCKTGPVVVIELRGWVGYQCPLCTRQVADFIAHADALRKAETTVVLVYPGSPDGLKQHADDFIAGKGLPDNFRFVTDPGLKFVDAWGLRWNKTGETAYPATFVIDRHGVVRFAKVSHSHGDRATAQDVLAVSEKAS
jgi:peroxiredoxin Q/BCP